MIYKDICVAIEAGRVDIDLLRTASAVTKSFEADLTVAVGGAVMPVPLPIAGFAGGGIVVDSTAGAESQTEAKNSVDDSKPEVETVMKDLDQPFTLRSIIGPNARIADFAVNMAQASDLFICFNPLKDDSVPLDRLVFEDVLRRGGCGTLVLPRGTAFSGHPASVIIAWNGSAESARAVRSAIPFLARAKEVTVLLVDPELRQAGEDWRPGDELVAHLAKYGVTAGLARVASAETSVAAAIEAEMEHKQADMVVMGGYGQSAIKDWILGSVGRELVESTHAAILMSN